VGFLDSLLGRSKGPARPKVDQLFALPAAAITLEVSLGMHSTGTGAVAFRAPEGVAFGRIQSEIQQLLDVDGPPVQISTDSFGYTWFLCSVDPSDGHPDVGLLVTEMNAVVSTLQGEGWGPQMLCALAHFRADDGRRLALVYLFKQGTFYPFAPLAGAHDRDPRRDTVLEFSVRDLLQRELPLEPSLERWHPLWDAPGL
jgi:hypothetical protein